MVKQGYKEGECLILYRMVRNDLTGDYARIKFLNL